MSSSPSCRLQFFRHCSSVGLVPWSAVLQAQCTSAWVPHRVTNETQKTCSSAGPCLHKATGLATRLLQHRLLMGSQPPLGICTFLGPPQAAGGSLLRHGSPWDAGTQLPHHGLHHRLQGNASHNTSSLPFGTHLGFSREVSLTYFHFFFLYCSNSFPFLNAFSQRQYQLDKDSALARGWSVLELAGTGSVGQGGSFWQVLPVALLHTIHLPCKSSTSH